MAAYIDVTLIDPVKTMAAVFSRKSRVKKVTRRSGKGHSAKSAAGVPAILMNHRKFQTRQDARLRAKEQEALQELIERMNGHQGKVQAAFRPVAHFPAIAAASRNEDGHSDSPTGRTALYLVKR